MIKELLSNRYQFQYKLDTFNARNVRGTFITSSVAEKAESIFYDRIAPKYPGTIISLSLGWIPHKSYMFMAERDNEPVMAFKVSAIDPKDAYRRILEELNLSCKNLNKRNFLTKLKELGFKNINFGTLLLAQL